MSKLKFTILMEDNLNGENLIAEHGLSVYIETEKHKLLVDTGKSEKTWDNAKVLGVDITKVDTVILSHGHYDHSGGLMSFAAVNPNAHIYMRENAGGEYYSYKQGEEKYIGIDKNILQLPNVHLISGNQVIDDELSLFINEKLTHPWPKGNKRLHEKKGEEYVQDTFTHEQNLVIKYDEGKYALISGCAHNGILNILDAFRERYQTQPSVVISGFHMVQSEYTEEDLEEIRKVAMKLAGMNTIFYTGHCTGEVAYNILKETIGEKLYAMWGNKVLLTND